MSAAVSVGVVYHPRTRAIQQIVVPDLEAELDDPAWTHNHALLMLRIPNAVYYQAPNREVGLNAIIAEFNRRTVV